MATRRRSLLDEPVGIDASRQRQARDRAERNAVQERNRTLRVGRRAYRRALRDGDYGTAMKAIDWMRDEAGTSAAGIAQAGEVQRGIGEKFDNLERQYNAYQGNGQQSGQGPLTSTAQGPYSQDQPATPDQFSGPPMGTPLQQRQNLFGRMVESAARGGDVGAFTQEAESLGIAPDAFARGVLRATISGIRGQQYNPYSQPQASLDSQSPLLSSPSVLTQNMMPESLTLQSRNGESNSLLRERKNPSYLLGGGNSNLGPLLRTIL